MRTFRDSEISDADVLSFKFRARLESDLKRKNMRKQVPGSNQAAGAARPGGTVPRLEASDHAPSAARGRGPSRSGVGTTASGAARLPSQVQSLWHLLPPASWHVPAAGRTTVSTDRDKQPEAQASLRLAVAPAALAAALGPDSGSRFRQRQRACLVCSSDNLNLSPLASEFSNPRCYLESTATSVGPAGGRGS